MKLDTSRFMPRILGLGVMAMIFCSIAWAQKETVIYTITAGTNASGVVLDPKGNLYGTMFSGGLSGAGTVFELSPSGSGTWTETDLYSFAFNDADGMFPQSGVVFDSRGNLYGVTGGGGLTGAGTVFQLSPQKNGTWSITKIYDFSVGNGPAWGSSLTIDSAGNLYGVTGGSYYSSNYGSVFELVAASNGAWTPQTLYTFAGGNDGGFPGGERLLLDSAGNVYGSAIQDGAHDYGVIFELVRGSNGNWTEKVLHAFTGGPDGSASNTSLAMDAAGNLYGNSNYSIFELAPNSNGTWSKKDIHVFAGGSDGAYSNSPLTFDKAGRLYGTTTYGGNHRGTVFVLSPGAGGTWSEKILYRFSGGVDGEYPSYFALALDAPKALYGTTQFGGSSTFGVVFAITP
jgi:uncharacterized repeat protein (TIGR03803 family)